MHFRQEISPSTDYGFWQSDHRDLYRFCQPPIFVHSSLGLCCISHDHRHFLPPVRMELLWSKSFRSHCFAFPISHSSSFEFLLHKYKINILTPGGRTKTKLADNEKAPIRPWMGANNTLPLCFHRRKALWQQNMMRYISSFVFYTLQSLQ